MAQQSFIKMASGLQTKQKARDGWTPLRASYRRFIDLTRSLYLTGCGLWKLDLGPTGTKCLLWVVISDGATQRRSQPMSAVTPIADRHYAIQWITCVCAQTKDVRSTAIQLLFSGYWFASDDAVRSGRTSLGQFLSRVGVLV